MHNLSLKNQQIERFVIIFVIIKKILSLQKISLMHNLIFLLLSLQKIL